MPHVQLSLDGDGDLILTPEMLHPSFAVRHEAAAPIYDGLLAEQGAGFDPDTRLAPLPLPVFFPVVSFAHITDECGEPFPCAHRAYDPDCNHPGQATDA